MEYGIVIISGDVVSTGSALSGGSNLPWVGGIVADLRLTDITKGINSCYSLGKVGTISNYAAGGIVGVIGAAGTSLSGTVTNCYSASEKLTGNFSFGGIVGFADRGSVMDVAWTNGATYIRKRKSD